MPESKQTLPAKLVEPLVVTLDVGSSSVRTLLYDGEGREIPGFGDHLPYVLRATSTGAIEVDADFLLELCVEGLSAIHAQMASAHVRPAAVAVDTFWHNVLGVDSGSRPTTPVLHSFDTQSAVAARQLAEKLDAKGVHARTGCVLHPSYLPAKLTWLAEARPEAFRAAKRWMSFGEYLFLKLLGTPAASTCMVSGSGLWNQNDNVYDRETLAALPVDASQFAPAEEMDKPVSGLLAAYASRWPLLAAIPWFPALGDGAANNVGSGCAAQRRFALMVGTSGALRAVVPAARIETPEGLWVYRLDRKRFVVGGALTDGGSVYAWMKKTLELPPDAEIEAMLAAMPPTGHGLTVLPLWAGERSPGWRAGARAAIIGLRTDTSPLQILRASLEAVALRFRLIYDILRKRLGEPAQIIATGGALVQSAAWTQMMADALARPVVPCLEEEATSRGAALMALERLSAIRNISEVPAKLGPGIQASTEGVPLYERALELQVRLYRKLFEED
jgi:gluconokinase